MLEFLSLAPHYNVTATAIDGLEGVDIDACRRLSLRSAASTSGAVFWT